jgi:Flp pilus assembly pilin Flp
MSLVRRLWADEAGFIISAELCLVATIVVIGLIVGLVTVRNQVVQELIAVGEAIGCINTSYAFCGLQSAHSTPPCAWTGGSWWVDYAHFCHPLPAEQGAGLWEGGITTLAVNGPGTGQGGLVGQ